MFVTKAKLRRIAITIFAITLAWSFVAWAAARALIVQKQMSHADVIVVLAGSSTYDERVRHAAELLKHGHTRRIVLTNDNQRGGWSEQKQTNPLFVVSASEELQNLGVPPDRIEIITPVSHGTYQEAILLREYAQNHRFTSVLIVTSAYHSRRALWTFNRVFAGTNIEIGIDAAAPGQQTPHPGSWWLHLRGWETVPVEYVKMAYYRAQF